METKLLKVILLGQANVGKTSIGRYLKYLNQVLALDTEPSTRIEKYALKIFTSSISLFVTPGQTRFRRLNSEFVSNIVDERTIVIYVIDAAATKDRIKAMLIDFISFLKLINSTATQKGISEVVMGFLAHKQDLPGAIRAEVLLGGLMNKLKLLAPRVKIHTFNTSIYYPSTIFTVIRQLILPNLLPMKTIHDIVVSLRVLSGSDAAVLSDSMGFPLATSGNDDIATWLSVFPAKILASIEEERSIMRNYRKSLWNAIFGGDHTSFELILETNASKRVYFSARTMNGEIICMSMFNPRKSINLLREITIDLHNRLSGVLFRTFPRVVHT